MMLDKDLIDTLTEMLNAAHDEIRNHRRAAKRHELEIQILTEKLDKSIEREHYFEHRTNELFDLIDKA